MKVWSLIPKRTPALFFPKFIRCTSFSLIRFHSFPEQLTLRCVTVQRIPPVTPWIYVVLGLGRGNTNHVLLLFLRFLTEQGTKSTKLHAWSVEKRPLQLHIPAIHQEPLFQIAGDLFSLVATGLLLTCALSNLEALYKRRPLLCSCIQ